MKYPTSNIICIDKLNIIRITLKTNWVTVRLGYKQFAANWYMTIRSLDSE